MSGTGLTTADYDPTVLAGIASATGGPGTTTPLGPISLTAPRAVASTRVAMAPPVRERVQRQAPQEISATGAAPKARRPLAVPDRNDPPTWGPKRTPDDLARFWSQEGGLTPVAAQGVALAAQQESGLH